MGAHNKTKRQILIADFETTTDIDDCRVWGWGLCDIGAETVWDVTTGHTIEEFFKEISRRGVIVYFHNLGFDGSFILDWIMRNGYIHTTGALKPGSFSTLINGNGQFYSITVNWVTGARTEFRDSLKKLPMSVANVAKAFSLDVSKGDLDYDKPRPLGYVMDREERSYIARDVLIVAKALRLQIVVAGMGKLTVGADALHEYRGITTRKLYDRLFPVLDADTDGEIRKAYRGGFTYVSKRFKGRRVPSGNVYDVNSLYPYVMRCKELPHGMPERFEGEPPALETHPLWIASVTITARLRKGHIPCIQIKGSFRFSETEYLERIEDPTTISCTNVDFDLWREHYHLTVISFNGGYLFQQATGLFNKYIDKWAKVKAESTGGMRQLAKLYLNSLYGKFATNPDVTGKVPIMDDDRVRLVMGEPETRDPVYTAMGVFITAYARDHTIRAAQLHYDRFIYADTDSLHMLDGDDSALTIHPTDLGAWKHEYRFKDAVFIRAKAYMERHHPECPCKHCNGAVGDVYETHVAGMPEKIAKNLTFEDFVDGAHFDGKLTPHRVRGGVVLRDVGFTLKY